MTRDTLIVLAVLCAGLAMVAAVMVREGERDRERLLADFTQRRASRFAEVAREVEGELRDIGEDLRFAAELVQASRSKDDRRRELDALLAVVERYKRFAVYGPDGAPRFAVRDRLLPTLPEGLQEIERELADAAAGLGPGELRVSRSITGDPSGWLRVFAAPLPLAEGGAGGTITVLVDLAPMFARLHLAATEPASAVLLLDGEGEAVGASEPGLLAAAREGSTPGIQPLLASMRRGEAGTLLLENSHASSLGLGEWDESPVVAAFAPLHASPGNRWSAASLISTVALRSGQRAAATRLGVASAAAAVWFFGFAAYLVIRSRREIAVRERLRHAEEVAHLLEKSEKVLDNIPVGVAVLSEDGRITAVNRALRERVPDPGLGRPLAETLPGAGAEVAARLGALVEAARRSGAVKSVVGARLPLFGRDGRYTVHAVPLEPSSPDARALLVVEDVSELHSVTMQLLRAEKLATVGVLAAGIAHEIGTPLGVVRGRAEMLAEKLGDGHPQTAGARIIVDEIDRVSRVIRQLLDFTRVRPADLGSVTVASVARAVAELLRFELERRKVTLTVEVPDDLDPVAANPDHLQQVLVNLVLNACDACAAGGRVAIRARRGEPVPGGAARPVRIEVVDDGCGIPEELRHQVFDPFFTTKKRGQGTGLGLTVAAQIVRNHGGEIDLESEPRRGTRVVLLWPAAGPAPAREKTHELRS